MDMGIMEALASVFINTFGITQPTEKTRRQAAWFILGMVVMVGVALVALGAALMHFIKS
jgi:hypothetical protein